MGRCPLSLGRRSGSPIPQKVSWCADSSRSASFLGRGWSSSWRRFRSVVGRATPRCLGRPRPDRLHRCPALTREDVSARRFYDVATQKEAERRYVTGRQEEVRAERALKRLQVRRPLKIWPSFGHLRPVGACRVRPLGFWPGPARGVAPLPCQGLRTGHAGAHTAALRCARHRQWHPSSQLAAPVCCQHDHRRPRADRRSWRKPVDWPEAAKCRWLPLAVAVRSGGAMAAGKRRGAATVTTLWSAARPGWRPGEGAYTVVVCEPPPHPTPARVGCRRCAPPQGANRIRLYPSGHNSVAWRLADRPSARPKEEQGGGTRRRSTSPVVCG